MHFEEMRIEALRLAVNGGGGPLALVLERAEAYFEFLRGPRGDALIGNQTIKVNVVRPS